MGNPAEKTNAARIVYIIIFVGFVVNRKSPPRVENSRSFFDLEIRVMRNNGRGGEI
jgi:hypothetical protein